MTCEMDGEGLRSLSSKSETAAAIRYALSRWRVSRATPKTACSRSITAPLRGRSELSLLGGKLLFVGSDCGGERAAAMYTLIGSAKLNGLDPELYLRTVLAQIADHPISHIQDLLPWNLAPSLRPILPRPPKTHSQVPTKKQVGTS